jgi:hypothetical protein
MSLEPLQPSVAAAPLEDEEEGRLPTEEDPLLCAESEPDTEWAARREMPTLEKGSSHAGSLRLSFPASKHECVVLASIE